MAVNVLKCISLIRYGNEPTNAHTIFLYIYVHLLFSLPYLNRFKKI